MTQTFLLDGQPVSFTPGQSVLQAALDAGRWIPHLCYHPDLRAHGSCKLCTVGINGRQLSSCTLPAAAGMEVLSNTDALNTERLALLELLFVEGNHFCPSCEQSGACQLQATAYALGMVVPHFDHFFPSRTVDASHPDFLIDFNRCILCSLCARASREVDGKRLFALAGRGLQTHLIVNSDSGLLGDTDFAASDMAARVCPVGAILPKRRGFVTPIGQRRYDIHPINEIAPKTEDGHE
jgi:[NiFe] hydrogenase diaphorase moiety small subunit